MKYQDYIADLYGHQYVQKLSYIKHLEKKIIAIDLKT